MTDQPNKTTPDPLQTRPTPVITIETSAQSLGWVVQGETYEVQLKEDFIFRAGTYKSFKVRTGETLRIKINKINRSNMPVGSSGSNNTQPTTFAITVGVDSARKRNKESFSQELSASDFQRIFRLEDKKIDENTGLEDFLAEYQAATMATLEQPKELVTIDDHIQNINLALEALFGLFHNDYVFNKHNTQLLKHFKSLVQSLVWMGDYLTSPKEKNFPQLAEKLAKDKTLLGLTGSNDIDEWMSDIKRVILRDVSSPSEFIRELLEITVAYLRKQNTTFVIEGLNVQEVLRKLEHN